MPTFNYHTHTWRKREQDPICDEFRTAIEKEFGRGDKMWEGAREIANHNVSASTIRRWIDGKTISPRFCKIGAAFAAMGYELRMVKKEDAQIIRAEKRFRPSAQAKRSA